MILSNDEQMSMLEDCQARESRLSDWEQSFIDSLLIFLGRGNALTAKQQETLQSIWDKATKEG